MKRFLVLDSFRGLCALAVVLHHIHATQSFTEWGFFRHANYLVNFFFVLSGFVLYHIYAERLNSATQLKRFVVARICRLYPLHVATLTTALLLEGLKLMVEQRGVSFTAASFTGPKAPSEILPNLLLLQSWWPGFNPMSFNFPSWSISVEFYLYLIFGMITLLMPTRLRLVFSAIAIAAFIALHFKSALLGEGALVGLACFFAGAMTYRVYARFSELRFNSAWATVLEALCLITVYLSVSHSEPAQNISLSLLFCAVIGIFAFEAGWLSTLLRTALFKWAGKLSFSIYMTHTLVLFVVTMGVMLVAKVTGQTLLIDRVDEISGGVIRYIDTGSLLLDNLLILGGLALVLSLSTFTYRYIELPGIELGKLWGRNIASDASPTPANGPLDRP